MPRTRLDTSRNTGTRSIVWLDHIDSVDLMVMKVSEPFQYDVTKVCRLEQRETVLPMANFLLFSCHTSQQHNIRDRK